MYIMPFNSIIQFDDAPKKAFRYTKSIENEYNAMLVSIANEVSKTLSEFDASNPESSLDVLTSLQDYANNLYEWGNKFVHKMVYNLNEDDKKQWLSHSTRMSASLRQRIETLPLEPLMRQYMEANVGLIQSMPLKAAQKVQELILENLKTGQYRAEGLVDQIMHIGNVTKNRAKLIARTETSRISTGLTKIRSDYLGVGFYIWRTSQDARVRSSHAHMSNVIVSWNDPPSPEALIGKKSHGHYHAGETFNCRCFARPIVRISDVTWPSKIYMNGRIQRILKGEFIELSHGKVPLAA
jgi:SPP1 gp7 family putative phage head morphogenesis protein